MSLFRTFLIFLVVLILLGWALFPIFYSLIISLSGFELPTKLGFPKEITLNNYIDALKDKEVWNATWNSLLIAIFATFLSIFTSIPSAYAFSRSQNKLSKFLYYLFLFFRLFPWIALAFPIFYLMAKLKLVDTYLGLGISHSVWIIPTSIWYLKGFFDMVPLEIEESALVDGASPFQVLLKVVLPNILPGLIAVSILAFMSSYTEYLYSLILTRTHTTTLPVLMAGYLSEFKVEWRKISAISMLSTIPMIIFYSYTLNFMKRGTLSGVIKG
jgi:multiple sugar transport system permease protein